MRLRQALEQWAAEHAFVIPAHGENSNLESCIQSLLGQALPSRVLLCAAEPTAFIRDLVERYPAVTFIHNTGPHGIAPDWNFALRQAPGKFCTLAHQDDVYHPEYLLHVAERFLRRPDSIITFTDYGDLVNGVPRCHRPYLVVKRLLLWAFYLKSSWSWGPAKRSALAFGNAVCCPSVTYNLERLGDFRFDESFTVNLDWAAWLRLSRQPGAFSFVRRASMLHRIDEGMETTAAIRENRRYREDLRIYEMLWPAWIARGLMVFYRLAYAGNRAGGETMKHENGRQLLFAGGASLLLRGGGALGILLLTILINRMLPVHDAGVFFLALTLVTLLATAGTLGLDTAALKFAAIEHRKRTRGFLNRALKLTGGASLALGVGAVLFLAAVLFYSGRPLQWTALLLIPAAAGMAFNRVQSQALFAHHRVVGGTFLQTGLIPWGCILLLGGGLLLPPEGRFSYAAVSYTLAVVAVAGIGFYLLRGSTAASPDAPERREMLHRSLPLLVIALLNILLDATDKFMLGWLDSAAAVAPYEAARQAVRGGELLLVSCNSIVAPRFAAMWHAGEFRALKSLLKRSTLLLFGLSFFVFLAYLVFGRFLMALNKPEFAGDSPVLLILAAGQCVVLGTGPVAHLLMMTGHERWHRNNVIACVAGNAILNYFLIPPYGIIGAAAATTFCLILKNIVTFGMAFHLLRKLPPETEAIT